MKQLILILLIIPLLTACPDKSDDKRQDNLEAFRSNHFNFTSLEKRSYKKIRFRLPKAFKYDYNTGYGYKTDAFARRDYDLGIIFTVERFTDDDLESELMEDYIVESDLLNAFHDAYTFRRYESLNNGGAAFKKDVKKGVGFPGVIQMLSGKSSSYSDHLYYATATLKIKDEYYIFQMISTEEMMGYVYDDFERILKSVRSK